MKTKIMRVLDRVTAGLLLLSSLLLIAGTVRIYLEGISPENMTAQGVPVRAMFSREIIAGQFRRISPVIYAALAAAAMNLCVHFLIGGKEKEHVPGKVRLQNHSGQTVGILRVLLFIAAVWMIAAGIMNGGMNDVLVKAAAICTECIGLG